MAFMGVHEIGIFLLMFSAGLPTGLPPEKEPAIITQIAPEECIGYVSWTGMAKPDPESTNGTEALLGEPSVREFFGSLVQQVSKYTADDKASLPARATPIVKTMLTKPMAVYFGKIGLGADGMEVDAGLVLKAGDDIDALKKQVTALELFLEDEAGMIFDTITIGGTQWRTLELEDIQQDLVWGTKGDTIIVGVGKKSIENILARAKTPTPKWLTDFRKRANVPRPGSTVYVSIKGILPLITSSIGDGAPFDMDKVYKAYGIDNVKYVGIVTGLDDTGVLSRTIIATDGPPHGVLGMIAKDPLALEDLSVIPADATFAMALRQSPSKWLEMGMEAVKSIEPNMAEEMEDEVLNGFQREFGLDLKKDILAPLGDKIRIYNSPEEGGFVVTGLTVFATLEDPKQATATIEKIMANANADTDRYRWEGTKQDYKGNTIYSFRYISPYNSDDPQIIPAVCVRGNDLVFSLNAACLKSALSRPKDFKSLADTPAVKTLFADGGAPSTVYYENTPELIRMAYPFLMMFSGIFSDDDFGPLSKLDWTKLPPSRDIYPHIKPSISSMRRTDEGLEITGRSTVPVNLQPIGLGVLFFGMAMRF